jgi:purine-binding chemotaxis protein CheW
MNKITEKLSEESTKRRKLMEEQNQIVIFTLGTGSYGIPITTVQEIIDVKKICSIPNVPKYIEGMLNIRGNIHFIFNLRKKLGMDEKMYDENTKIILVNGRKNGFIVDEVSEIIRVEENEIETNFDMPVDINGDFINGFAKVKEDIVIILNLDNLLSMKEVKR